MNSAENLELARIVDKKLLYKGFVYLRSRERNGKTYWDCNRLRQGQCCARAVTIMNRNEVIVIQGPEKSLHSHPLNREEGEAEIVKDRLKRIAAENPEQPPSRILRTELINVPENVISLLPERANLAKSMRTHRKRDLPANPKSIEDLEEIPDRFINTLAGEKFLIYDSHDSLDGRVIVFATRRNLELLAKSKIWFLDGTFKVSPTIFTQVFTILGLVKKNSRRADTAEYTAFPLAFALLSSKETTQYTAALRALKNAANEYGIYNFRPHKIVGDFEKAIINACAAIFPTVPYSACFFHFTQSVYRKIQESGLQAQYNDPDNRDLKLNTHMLMALAFVPIEDVAEVYNIIADNAPDELSPILEYLELNYIFGKPARGRRRAVPPRYEISLWNHYESTCQGHQRTNNISEGWHNRFSLLLGKHHPDLYSALREFQREQADTEIMIAELSLGRTVKAAPKKMD